MVVFSFLIVIMIVQGALQRWKARAYSSEHFPLYWIMSGNFFVTLFFVIYFFLHLGILKELLYENDAPRYPNHHRVRLSIMSPGLHHEIWIPFIPPDEMTVERVLISVEHVLQSDKKWLFAGTMRLTFVHADLPVGRVA